MAYKITEECISCSACEGECKNEAISEGDTRDGLLAMKCSFPKQNLRVTKKRL